MFYRTSCFKNGWIIGDFLPSIIRTKDFEVAIHDYKKGHESDGHYHKIATEVNVIITGKVLFFDSYGKEILYANDIFVYKPYDISQVAFLEDTKLLIIKTPSVPGDKYYD